MTYLRNKHGAGKASFIFLDRWGNCALSLYNERHNLMCWRGKKKKHRHADLFKSVVNRLHGVVVAAFSPLLGITWIIRIFNAILTFKSANPTRSQEAISTNVSFYHRKKTPHGHHAQLLSHTCACERTHGPCPAFVSKGGTDVSVYISKHQQKQLKWWQIYIIYVFKNHSMHNIDLPTFLAENM